MSLKRKTLDELPPSNHARRLQQLEESRDVWGDHDAPWAARAPPQLQWDAEAASRVRDFDPTRPPDDSRVGSDSLCLPSSPQSDAYTATAGLLHHIESAFREQLRTHDKLTGHQTMPIIRDELAKAVAHYHQTPRGLLRMASDELKEHLAHFAPYLAGDEGRRARQDALRAAEDALDYGDVLQAAYTPAPSKAMLLRGGRSTAWAYDAPTLRELQFLDKVIDFLLAQPDAALTRTACRFGPPYYYSYFP